MLVALCRLCVRTEEAAASVASACPERAQVPSTLCSPPEPARARERPSFDFPPLTEAAAALAAHISIRLTFPYTTFTACCAAVAIAITAIATTASTAAAVDHDRLSRHKFPTMRIRRVCILNEQRAYCLI